MKVLVTGAFGNIGKNTIASLLERGHDVTTFDLKTRANEKAAKRIKVRPVWGDIRKPESIELAVIGQDVVIHLAFIIPSLSATGVSSEAEPLWAREINVGGTRNLILAMEAQPAPPRLIFASSCAIYGRTQHLEPPRMVSELPNPVEHYSRHKVLCEQMVRSSSLTWTITRFAAALPISLSFDVGMFSVPLSDRMEFVHTRDLGDALSNAVTSKEVAFKTLNLGGGPRCQYYYHEITEKVLGAAGIDSLPDEAFTSIPFHTDWLDTRESQALLHYQTRNIDDYVNDMKTSMGWRAGAARVFQPIIRHMLLKRSNPFQRAHARKDWQGKVALVTGASQGIGKAIARTLALNGFSVALTARGEPGLEQVAESIAAFGGSARVIPADLTRPEERHRLLSTVRRDMGPIDLLINNAGVGWYGYASTMSPAEVRSMISLNVDAVTELSLSALNEMVSKNGGHIVNIGSVAGQIPSQGVALYSATKAFVSALTTALHRETAGTGVHVSLVLAGPVSTAFFAKAGMRQGGKPFVAERWSIAPGQVADAVISLLKRPRRAIYAPWAARFTPWVEAFFGWLMDLIGPALLRSKPVSNPSV